MAIKVNLYSGLSDYTGGRNEAEVKGNTIGECLADLTAQFPSLKRVLFEKNGELFKHIFVSVNLKSAYPEQLDVPVKEGDELHITFIIVGG
jgi:molybdopterin converting factor small subunit